MAFTPKTAPFSGKINAVTLGTGDKAIVIGGQNVMPFTPSMLPSNTRPRSVLKFRSGNTVGCSCSEGVLRRLHHHG